MEISVEHHDSVGEYMYCISVSKLPTQVTVSIRVLCVCVSVCVCVWVCVWVCVGVCGWVCVWVCAHLGITIPIGQGHTVV